MCQCVCLCVSVRMCQYACCVSVCLGVCVYLVIKVQVDESWDAFGELGDLAYGLHGAALTAVEDMHSDLLLPSLTQNSAVPHQPALRTPQRTQVIDHKLQ